jgi:hypothetical protein
VCHAVVLGGRIDVLGDGSGKAELSVPFSATPATGVEITGRDSEGGGAGCLPDNRAVGQKSA